MKTPAFFLLLMSALCHANAQTPAIDTILLQHKCDIPFADVGLPQKVVQDRLGRPMFYVAAKEGGLRIFDVSDITQPVLKQMIPLSGFYGQEVMNVHQDGPYLYLALGNFFGGSNPPGLAIVDVGDPENAVVKDVWVSDSAGRGCAFVTVSGDYAYLGAMSQGLIILNIENKSNIFPVSQYVPDVHFPVQNPNSVQLPNARGMEVRNDTVWLCYDAGGLRLIDVFDKTHPVEVGRYINPDVLGKQQAYNNLVLRPGKAFIAVDYCGLEVLDISNPANIHQTGWWNPWECQSPSNAWLNSPGHSNQVEMDTARQLVFLSTGRSELNIVDVSDPAFPKQVGSYGIPDDNFFAWGVGLYENRVYLTYISSLFPFFSIWSGVKILEWDAVTGISDPQPSIDIRLIPNPFRHGFSIEMECADAGINRLQLIDQQGNLVSTWTENVPYAGKHTFEWQGRLAAGLYWLKVTGPSGSIVKRLICAGE